MSQVAEIKDKNTEVKLFNNSLEQSFPLETVIGGAGGSTPDLHGNVSSSNLFVNITQSWSGSINTPVGIVAFVDQTQNEFDCISPGKINQKQQEQFRQGAHKRCVKIGNTACDF